MSNQGIDKIKDLDAVTPTNRKLVGDQLEDIIS